MLKIKNNVDLEKYGFNGCCRDDYRPNSRLFYDYNLELHLILYSNPSKLPLEVFDENIIKAYVDDLIKDGLVEKVKE